MLRFAALLATALVAVSVSAQEVAAPARATPELRPRIYVGGIDELATLVAEDPSVSAAAGRLVSRRNTAVATIILGALAGSALIVWGGMETQNCAYQGGMDACTRGTRLVLIGSGVGSVSFLVGLLMRPQWSDMVGVVNAWNIRHPERPLELP